MAERAAFPTRTELALGAFLHDIGKFSQRAASTVEEMPRTVYERASDVLPSFKGRSSHWHALWSDAFFETVFDACGLPPGLDGRWIRDCAVYHHKPLQDHAAVPNASVTEIVAEADRIAAGMERKKRDEENGESIKLGRDAYRKAELKSLLTKIRLEGRDGAPRELGYPVREFTPDSLIPSLPDAASQPDRYKRLWADFKEAYKDMARRACGNESGGVSAYVSGLLSLAERFTWAIPSSTIDEPDVGLYDHARVTAAAAAALYAHHEARGDLDDVAAIKDRTREKFRLVTGDLSGIQRSLFLLASEGAQGLARLLRGRSLRFQLITEAAARRTLKAFDLPEFNLIMNAGCRFIILIPFTEEDEQRKILDCLQADIDGWVRTQYAGDLLLNLSMTAPSAPQDFLDKGGARRVIDESFRAAEIAKLNPLSWAREPVRDVPFDAELGICTACGRRPAVRETAKGGDPPRCTACHAEERLGRRFPKAAAILLDRDANPRDDEILDVRVALPEGGVDGALPHGWRLHGRRAGEGLPLAERFAGAHVPRHDQETLARPELARVRLQQDGEDTARPGDVITFAELAECSRTNGKGRPMLACLKADVDRLGQIFANGLGERYSLGRVTALSRMMDAFFTGWLPHTLEKTYPFLYTVYAGGDDLMVLGPWHDVLRFALALRKGFEHFTGNNPSVTISAGISLFDPRTPVTRASEQAEIRMSEAKSAGRDRVSAIAQGPSGVMTWDQYSQILDQSDQLSDYIESGRSGVSTALIYKLLQFDAERWDCEINGNQEAAGWRAKLGYSLARALPVKGARSQEHEQTRDFLLKLMGMNRQLDSQHTKSAAASIALSIALYRQR